MSRIWLPSGLGASAHLRAAALSLAGQALSLMAFGCAMAGERAPQRYLFLRSRVV